MELKKYKLADIGKVITGKTPSTSIAENYACGTIPFYTPEDVAKGLGMMGRNNRFITQTGFEEIASNTITGESVLVGCIGSDMGNVAYSNITCATNQQINSITQFINGVEPLYVYYLLSTMKPYFQKIAGSTTTPILPKSIFEEIEIHLPDIKIQKDVVSILYALDHKIELNKQINDNLEAMAKQFYDYWFVQFDFPNEEGKPYKSSGGAMVWNEKLKREIPQGWSGVSLKDLALTSRNAITPVENEVYQHFSIPSFDACGSYSLDNGSDIKSDKFVLQKGQLLVSKLNPWFNRVVWVPKGTNMIGSTEFVVLNPNNESESGYIYSVIKSPKFIAYCSQAATGTSHSQRRVSPDVLMAFKVVYEQGVVQKYGCLIEKIQKQQAELLSEIAMLTKQRDELLPLLMNGQASVNYHLSASTSISFDISVLVLNFTNGNSLYETISLDYQHFALPLQSKENTHGTIQEDKRHIQQRQRQGDKHARERFLAFFYKCTSTIHQAAFGNAWCYRGYKGKNISESK